MQKNPTAGGGGLKGSRKNAKVTKKVRTHLNNHGLGDYNPQAAKKRTSLTQ